YLACLCYEYQGGIEETVQDYIHVQGLEIPEGTISANATEFTDEEFVQFCFAGNPGDAPSVFTWDLGDGNTSSSFSPVHLYDSPGVYQVTLKILDVDGDIFSSPPVFINVLNSNATPEDNISGNITDVVPDVPEDNISGNITDVVPDVPDAPADQLMELEMFPPVSFPALILAFTIVFFAIIQGYQSIRRKETRIIQSNFPSVLLETLCEMQLHVSVKAEKVIQPVQIFKVKTISRVDQVKEDQCIICFEPIECDDEIITCSFCGRRGHTLCMTKWLEDHSLCPVCLHEFVMPNSSTTNLLKPVLPSTNWNVQAPR
ncbi:MAG: PKD domain-containing protein, partial [Candidatus Hodarchaeota archaeon]